jgi:hypothetical protein
MLRSFVFLDFKHVLFLDFNHVLFLDFNHVLFLSHKKPSLRLRVPLWSAAGQYASDVVPSPATESHA